MKRQVSKKTNNAFGKKIFLLGRDEDGTNYWLEEAKWDCGWYWGFGYVETYTNNQNPNKSKDINSHQHIDSSIMGQMQKYDFEKKCYINSEFVHNIFDALCETTFTENEGWQLSELFKSFYMLKESAAMFGRGGCNLTTNPCSELIKNEDWAKQINHEILPLIFEKIYSILSPKK
jgi:hypothetical protein